MSDKRGSRSSAASMLPGIVRGWFGELRIRQPPQRGRSRPPSDLTRPIARKQEQDRPRREPRGRGSGKGPSKPTHQSASFQVGRSLNPDFRVFPGAIERHGLGWSGQCHSIHRRSGASLVAAHVEPPCSRALASLHRIPHVSPSRLPPAPLKLADRPSGNERTRVGPAYTGPSTKSRRLSSAAFLRVRVTASSCAARHSGQAPLPSSSARSTQGAHMLLPQHGRVTACCTRSRQIGLRQQAGSHGPWRSLAAGPPLHTHHWNSSRSAWMKSGSRARSCPPEHLPLIAAHLL